MSHHDVVDGDDKWETNPFDAVEKDGALFGRGTIDTKTPLFAELQACEELLKEGYEFDGINLYIGSSNNEEVCGDGMVLATEYFKENGIHFEAVLDEGGAITTGMIPTVTGKSAMVAVHEKSRHLYKCKATQITKGHGGLNPSDDSSVLRLSSFISEVGNAKIYKAKFQPEVRATFEAHAPYMAFPLNFLFNHLSLFAPIIKKQSPGPIFFSQIRVGKNGRQFKLYKFRSMYTDAEERKKELMEQNQMQGFMFKMEDDPRIFPIGKFMRKFSIDELPQFWNVLRGDMSLVGTRPPTLDEFEQYETHHRARLGNKPGLTGMWQVSGRSKITDFEEVVSLDTAYISNWNLAMDVRILFKTVKVVLLGRGAE